MDKIDRLGWADGLSFLSYGVRVGIRVSDSSALDRVQDLLPPGWKPSRSPVVERLYSFRLGGDGPRPGFKRLHVLYGDATEIARTRDLDEALERLEADLSLCIAQRARRRIFVHAGVVAWKERAIVIPGRSFTGKSSLVAELVRRGATYYSDEYAVFDEKGLVHPFPRPLGLRSEGSHKQTKCTVESIGGLQGGRPLPLGLVLISAFKANAVWRPRSISRGRAAVSLLANAVPARSQPQSTLAILSLAARRATAFSGPRGEASQTAVAILDIADRASEHQWRGKV